ncbi:MAG: zinc ribbon domain-containing protein [bacterium]|nr:zinc ribbon domain-containing protein [bacterium]
MPTYEYQCIKCGHRFEELQSIKALPLNSCPVCSGQVERLIGTGSGFIFKGAGFYATEYRSSEYNKSAKADSDKIVAIPTPAPSPAANKSSEGDKK